MKSDGGYEIEEGEGRSDKAGYSLVSLLQPLFTVNNTPSSQLSHFYQATKRGSFYPAGSASILKSECEAGGAGDGQSPAPAYHFSISRRYPST